MALDDDHKPARVPEIAPETPEEEDRYEEAGLRREPRLAHAERMRVRRKEADHDV